MKYSSHILALAVTANAASLCSTPRWSIKGADTVVSRDYANGLQNGKPYITYEHGVIWRALEMVYNATSNASYVDHIQKSADNIVTSGGSLLDYDLGYYTLDDIRVGESLIYLTLEIQNTKVQRTFFAHNSKPSPAILLVDFGTVLPIQQMWLDGLYMASPFYTHHTATYVPSNKTAFDDVVKQFNLTHTNCQSTNASQFGLLKHGYDSSHKAVWADAATGASPEVWDRAMGWYVMAIVDVLDFFPSSNSGFATLKSILEENVAAIKKAVETDSKNWWLVMSQPGRKKNYIESSGSAMFVYAILKGIRLGYLDSAKYLKTATDAYEQLVARFVAAASDGGIDWNGTVMVGSLSGKADFDYYVSVPIVKNDLKGVGPFIMASVEYEKAVCT